jgi:outer membrane protein assembly factor BamB
MSGLNAADGRVMWQRDLAVMPGIAAADGVIFASDFVTGALMAVDALTGKLLWKHAEIEHWPSAPAVAGDAVYVGYLNSMQAFSARTGEQLWNYPAEGLITKLAVGRGILYAAVDAAGTASQLYALRG